MLLFRLLLPSICFCLTAPAIPAATFTNTPSADTYFEAYGSESANFGRAPIFRIDQWGGRQAFLRFALRNVPPDRRILRATIRLWITEVGFNEQGEFPDLKTCVELYDVVTPWSEDGLTYRSADGVSPWNQGPGIAEQKYADVGPLPKPDLGASLHEHAIPLDPKRTTNDSWLDLDVTEFLRQQQAAGKLEVNLLLRSSTVGRNYTFASREASDSNHRPQLVLWVAEQLPAFRLEGSFLTQWTPGTKATITLNSWTNASAAVQKNWNLDDKPAGSKLRDTDLAANEAGVSFVPDVPGRYRVHLSVRSADTTAGPGSAPEQSTTEKVDVYALSVASHPRLYVASDTRTAIQQDLKSGSRLSKAFVNWVDAGAAGAGQGKFHDMGVHEGCENTALAWLLTGDERYLAHSIAYARKVLEKPMREHFEDVHAATFLGASWVHAMSVHYDWCYDRLPPEHRRAVAEWLKEAASWAWVRSGAPIAHNDGGARQCLLASAALALLGDDPEAQALYLRSRENFDRMLLPWLNDGGRGGRSGDGGEYEGLHGFYIVKYAWMAQTATGEDVFGTSPFFFNRLQHILFGWYPRRLVERNGAYSMREYYSPSGDHTRMGYVGDTQPYQSAAALCSRYRDTRAAQGVRWLAGDWPTQWMQYTLRWAVLGRFESVPAREPAETAYFDPGCNTVYARSDWTDDATWMLFENAPYVSAHGSLDSGTFEIFKGDLLAARTGNLDHANVGAAHTMNYLHRTIAGNCLLIHDPNEKWKGFLGGAEGGQDGGGERTNFPLSSSPDAGTFLNYRHVFRRGEIQRFRNTSELAYALADLTPAYNSAHFHSGSLNSAKVRNFSRQLLYCRSLDSVFVFDRVSSTKPEFKKTWLLHSLGDLDVLDGTESKLDDGEYSYTGATRAVIRYGWPKPVPSFARCLSVTLLPENAQLTKIGGRIDLPKGKTEGFSGDQWHGQHQHHHLKDFWVNGTNYPPGNPPETRWFGEPTSDWYVPGTPDESGGRGKWRLEVSPAGSAEKAVFFHVLCPRLGREGEFPKVERLQAGAFEGAVVSEGSSRAAIFFATSDERASSFSCVLPGGAKMLLGVADLAPGTYHVTMAGAPPAVYQVEQDGLLVIQGASGEVKASLH